MLRRIFSLHIRPISLYSLQKKGSSYQLIFGRILDQTGTAYWRARSIVDGLAGINLELVDFIQKPVDIELLVVRMRRFFVEGKAETLRERDIILEIAKNFGALDVQ